MRVLAYSRAVFMFGFKLVVGGWILDGLNPGPSMVYALFQIEGGTSWDDQKKKSPLNERQPGRWHVPFSQLGILVDDPVIHLIFVSFCPRSTPRPTYWCTSFAIHPEPSQAKPSPHYPAVPRTPASVFWTLSSILQVRFRRMDCIGLFLSIPLSAMKDAG